MPADLRLLELRSTTLNVEQAQLTGESTSVGKDVDALSARAEDVVQAKTNCLFATTVVVNGIGMGLVVCTGMATEIGAIQASVKEAAEEESDSPLKKKLVRCLLALPSCLSVWLYARLSVGPSVLPSVGRSACRGVRALCLESAS